MFLDAQENPENPLEPPCTPQINSDNGSDSEPEPETVVPHNISLPTSDSGGETFLKTVLEPSIMESPSPSQSQQSQSQSRNLYEVSLSTKRGKYTQQIMDMKTSMAPIVPSYHPINVSESIMQTCGFKTCSPRHCTC